MTTLATIASLQLGSTAPKRARLAGEAGLAAFKISLLPEYVAQAELRASYALGDLLAPPTVTVGLHRSLVGGSLRRAVYTVEGALTYALRHSRRQPMAVIAAEAASAGDIFADVLVARDSRLVHHIERRLPAQGSQSHIDVIAAMIAEIRKAYPVASIVQAGGVDLAVEGVPYIGILPSRGRPVLAAGRNLRQKLALPGLVALAGLVFYLVALALGWSHYHTAESAYHVAAADPVITRAGGIDNAAIDVLQQRKLYMEAPRRQVLLAKKAAQIVAGIGSVPGVMIVSMSLPAPSIRTAQQFGVNATPMGPAKSDQPDVRLTVAVAKSSSNALDQAQVVMEQLARATGLSLRLQYAGWREQGATRQFILEGFVHGNN